MAWKPEIRAGAVRKDCPRCGLPTIRQTSGLPWAVTVDDTLRTPAEAEAMTTPNRRAFCLRESRWSGMRLAEVLRVFHSPVCVWPHVVEHECPPGTPAVKGALW